MEASMKKLILVIGLLFVCSVRAEFVILETVDEFENFIKTPNVPVLVQFSASWCQPCQQLKATFQRVAPSYNDSQVRLAYVDADENSSLQHYLQGGYPTVRT